MRIELKKFGDLLTSRQDGREALSAIEPLLMGVTVNENIELDFKGVTTFTPSWADEFITKLNERFGNRVFYLNDENSSVKATLALLLKLKNKTI